MRLTVPNKGDVWDNLIRVESVKAAAELLEMR